MANIRLYYSPGACSLASHILLHETGVPFETVKIDVKAGAPEELREINAKMRIPVLSINNETVTETPAIMTAIAQLSPSSYLMGSTPLESVRTYEWLNWPSGTLHGQAFAGLLRPQRFSDDASTFPSIKVKARKTIEECFSMIERDLAGVHAVGGRFTAVDAFLYVFYRWGAGMGMDMKTGYPKFTDLVVELAKRKSVQAALEVERLGSSVSSA